MKKFSLLFGFIFIIVTSLFAQTKDYNLLIGTYTNTGKSEGIYTYNFNSLTGKTNLKSVTKNVDNPSYLALSPNKKFVYAVNEKGATSSVSSFKYSATTGKLKLINKVTSGGADPCYITVDENNVIVANYSGGNLAVFQRREDGSLTKAVQIIKNTGKSIDPKGRQTSAHVHMVKFTPDHKYLVVNDLGEDQTYVYHYNPKGNDKTLALKNVYKTNAGTGPRHMTFSPDGKFAYLVHEFNGSITAFRYANGNLTKLQEIETVAKDFKGKIDGAAIHISADGKFLYETNRGDANSISTFSILTGGKLKFIESVSTLGKGPRNFTIDPTGNYLLVGHQNSNDVVIFKRNKLTGKLTDSGERIDVGAPVCLVFD
ncbi:lactonase family protein [Pedobacter changchengzhani]|uniref:Lactonase family protein n=1 Tax=Pedobacter changchengzhani TaxID=2529274 RepID=A0A4R5MI15_9SPHI|nr:lactonase family protein [Pedobacter changchengzhani]TDG35188.1 lactonase family protein [Pedobacter changchengzhani]